MSKKTVLIADDEEQIISIIKKHISKYDLNIVCACTGLEAMEVFNKSVVYFVLIF